MYVFSMSLIFSPKSCPAAPIDGLGQQQLLASPPSPLPPSLFFVSRANVDIPVVSMEGCPTGLGESNRHLSCCCDKIPSRGHFRMTGFIPVHSGRVQSIMRKSQPQGWGSQLPHICIALSLCPSVCRSSSLSLLVNDFLVQRGGLHFCYYSCTIYTRTFEDTIARRGFFP